MDKPKTGRDCTRYAQWQEKNQREQSQVETPVSQYTLQFAKNL